VPEGHLEGNPTMTFTEAAVEVLRLVGKPLHYKKIAEIAIERNLLSHVGKTPEITMSSRLATMVKKDRGEAPIVKVKPGVFGLRDFSADVLEAAEAESGHEYDLPEPAKAEAPAAKPPKAEANGDDGAEAAAERPHRLPGSEVFPEEDDDDEPILAKLDQDDGADRNGSKRTRKRRRRKGKGGGERSDDRGDDRRDGRRDERRADDGGRSRRNADDRRGRRREGSSRGPGRPEIRGDWDRVAPEAEPRGQDLADAVFAVLAEGRRRDAMGHADVAAQLVKRGRLTGEPSALAPTVAAAVWGDNARRRGEGQRCRFRTVQGGLVLLDWDLPTEAVRAEQDAVRAAERQRDAVHRTFLRRLSDMPVASFMELVAGWLNAEGVTALRGVRPPVQGGYHLAGTLRAGGQETGLAIVIYRDGSPLGREHVIDVRGALHHYGNASAAWLVSTGRIQSGAREEAAAPGQTPCVLVDGAALAVAMERMGIGLQRVYVPLSVPDLDLLETLSPTVTSERASQPSSRRKARGDDDDAAAQADTPTDTPEESAEAKGGDEGEAEAEDDTAARPKRRRRRRGSRGGRSESESESESKAGSSDEAPDGEESAKGEPAQAAPSDDEDAPAKRERAEKAAAEPAPEAPPAPEIAEESDEAAQD
jgi:hypothetical protein